MRALHEVVQSGKVRYIGASSMYTWEFARLQYIARSHGWTEFISMQPFHNLLYREEEREMLPFCRASGVGVIPWSPIARGLLARPLPKKDGQEEGELSLRQKEDKKTDIWFADANLDIVNRVEEVAKNKGVSMALVEQPYVNHVPTVSLTNPSPSLCELTVVVYPQMTGGIGRASLTEFYRHHFIFNNSADTELELISRTVGIDRVVDEFIFKFTHDKEIDWM